MSTWVQITSFSLRIANFFATTYSIFIYQPMYWLGAKSLSTREEFYTYGYHFLGHVLTHIRGTFHVSLVKCNNVWFPRFLDTFPCSLHGNSSRGKIEQALEFSFGKLCQFRRARKRMHGLTLTL